MLESLITVAGQVVTLFLMMAVGFALVRFGMLSHPGLSQMSTLLLYVVAPCILIRSFQQEGLPTLSVLGMGAVALGSYYLIFMPLSALLFRKNVADTGVVLRFGSVYGNSSFMGLPLLAVVLGQEALIFGVISFVVFSIAQWTHGAVAMGGRFSLKKSILNPGVIGFLLGLPLLLFHWKLPAVVNTAVSFLADLNTPLAMVVIGGQMAGANLVATFTQPKLYLAAAIKLIVLPALVLGMLLPLGLSPLLYCTCVVLAATPTAGTTGIFAQKFNRDTATAAQLITLSTLVSIFTLPIFSVLSRFVANGLF